MGFWIRKWPEGIRLKLSGEYRKYKIPKKFVKGVGVNVLHRTFAALEVGGRPESIRASGGSTPLI